MGKQSLATSTNNEASHPLMELKKKLPTIVILVELVILVEPPHHVCIWKMHKRFSYNNFPTTIKKMVDATSIFME